MLLYVYKISLRVKFYFVGLGVEEVLEMKEKRVSTGFKNFVGG